MERRELCDDCPVNRGTATITIVGGILDTGDTRQMDAFAAAMREVDHRCTTIVVVSA